MMLGHNVQQKAKIINLFNTKQTPTKNHERTSHERNPKTAQHQTEGDIGFTAVLAHRSDHILPPCLMIHKLVECSHQDPDIGFEVLHPCTFASCKHIPLTRVLAKIARNQCWEHSRCQSCPSCISCKEVLEERKHELKIVPEAT